jgi:hypothetical protein
VIVALVIGTLLAVGALAYVLYPVFFGVAPTIAAQAASASSDVGESAIAALREIEFDRATGKLSDPDYVELKTRYTRQAIDAMRRGGERSGPAVRSDAAPSETVPSDEEIEATIQAYRRRREAGCPACGPRPEPDAVFCSTCGRYLRDRCAGCGAPVLMHDARYCVRCGSRLAA